MIISELIAKLEQARNEYGDARVEVRNPAGDWDDAEELQATHFGNPFDAEPKWVVFIDV